MFGIRSVWKKQPGQGAGRAARGFTLFISNKDTDDIIKIVESLEKLGLLIDGASETVKHKIKKVDFFLLWWHQWLLHW